MERERFRNCLLVPSAQAWPLFGPENSQGCSALLCAWQDVHWTKGSRELSTGQGHPPDMGSSPVFSGMEAWSVFLSFLKEMFPNCSTEDTTFSIAVRTRDTCISSKAESSAEHIFLLFLVSLSFQIPRRSSGRKYNLYCAFWANGLNSTPVGVKQTFSSGCQRH